MGKRKSLVGGDIEEAKRKKLRRHRLLAKLAPDASIANLEPIWKRWSLYELVSLEDRTIYFEISKRPLTERVEEDLELVSGVVSGEGYRHFWETGVYHCARCSHRLYSSQDKWEGPCIWPSFRRPADESESLLYVPVESYNNYTCVVKEVYCKSCELFLGHAFEDGVMKGDKHPDARWRH